MLPGTILLEAAARAGFILETPCGGAGKCGKCLVRITSGACPGSPDSDALIGAERISKGYRLACRCRVEEDVVVEIPSTSLFQTGQRILSEDSGEAVDVCPEVCKQFLSLDPPTREDPISDTERLRRALGDVEMDIDVMRALPGVLRQEDFKVTVTLTDHHVVNIEAGDTTGTCCGVALDVGTTTLVCTLVDLSTGEDLAVTSTVNPQTSLGDDVVSRIKRCRDEPDGLSQLNRPIIAAVNALIDEAAKRAGVARHNICETVIAGNTTMQQIFCGINPAALGEIPFVPAFREALSLPAASLGIEAGPGASVYVFPQIGGFVGGDTVAGIIATRLDRMDKPALLVDVGTNGEIVLAHNGKLTATSVAAGPAFEGARIIHGMRASNGAIEKVVIDGDLRINVIGNVPAAGICGTGLIDAAAAMLRTGVLDETGRVLGPEELPTCVPAPIRQRVVQNNGQYDFVLAFESETATGEALCLHQRDIRELQLANGAIRAGIRILLAMEGLDADDLGAVLLAGAFGNFIRRSNARRIGMLPQVDTERIRFVGNTASFGAKRALLSSEERDYAARVAAGIQHIDLSLNPDFQMEFSMAMLFPEE